MDVCSFTLLFADYRYVYLPAQPPSRPDSRRQHLSIHKVVDLKQIHNYTKRGALYFTASQLGPSFRISKHICNQFVRILDSFNQNATHSDYICREVDIRYLI